MLVGARRIKCARTTSLTKCVRTTSPTKCARTTSPTKCARTTSPTKCARTTHFPTAVLHFLNFLESLSSKLLLQSLGGVTKGLQRRKLKRSLKRNVQENGIQKESVRRRSEMAFGKFRPLLQADSIWSRSQTRRWFCTPRNETIRSEN
jgi:hypothetical protein